jgi:hypothetical protein
MFHAVGFGPLVRLAVARQTGEIAMKKCSMLVLTGVLGLSFGALPALASLDAGAETLGAETAKGNIKSVDTAAKSFVISVEGKDVTVRTNEKTIYMWDGAVSTMDKVVKAGNDVIVSHEAGLASKVEGHTKKPS